MQPLQQNHSAAWTYLELAEVIILVLRKDETVEFINRKGCELLGHSQEFITGKNWFEFFIPAKAQATDKYHYARAIGTQQLSSSYENNILTRSGQELTIAWHGTFVRNEVGDIEGILAAGEDVTAKLKRRKFSEQQQRAKNQQILSAVVEAQEKERSEIASELHGNVNHILTTCKLLLESEKSKQPSSTVLTNVYEYLQNAIDEIRGLSHRLDSSQLKYLGLAASIKSLFEKVDLANKYHLTVLIDDHTSCSIINERIAVSVYRIVQEQLSNIIKHADASAVVFSLKCTNEKISVHFTDDGKGFNLASSHQGLGLRNIYSRVALHQGTVSLLSSPGAGCTLDISIPIKE